MHGWHIRSSLEAVVGSAQAEQGRVCVLSAIGDSVVVHCEDMIIPLKEAKLE